METSWLVGNICAERGVEYKEEAVTVDKLQGLQIRQGGGRWFETSRDHHFLQPVNVDITTFKGFFLSEHFLY